MLNLKKRRLELGYTMLEVAKAVGVSEAAISRYENGSIKNMRRDRIINYAKVLQVEPTEFLELEVTDTPPKVEKSEFNEFSILEKDNIYTIPVFKTVSAGFGAYADNQICGYEPIYLTSKREAEETIAITVSGDSMYPKIEDNDIVVVHKQEYFNNGDIVVAVVCGEDNGFVKRAFRNENKLTLESINPIYPPMIFTGTKLDEVKIMGVVKKIIKSV